MDAAGNGGVVIDLARTMMTQGVLALGASGQGPDTFEPIAATAQEKKIVFIPADSGKSEYSPYYVRRPRYHLRARPAASCWPPVSKNGRLGVER